MLPDQLFPGASDLPAKPPTLPLLANELSTPAPLPLTLRPVEQYYKGSALTRRPQVQQDITPFLRLKMAGPGSRQVILRLLINEQGGIDRVDMSKADLPPLAQQAVADAFSSLRFSPGLLGEAAVRSQLRIEVTLEGPAELPVFDLRGK